MSFGYKCQSGSQTSKPHAHLLTDIHITLTDMAPYEGEITKIAAQKV